jgi:alginate export protein
VNRVGVAAGVLVLSWTAAARAQVQPPAPETLAVGDWKIAPVVEARVRGEYRHDFADDDRGLLTERARLGADVLRGDVEGRVVLQDARTWDLTSGQPYSSGAPFGAITGIYEAWGEAHTSAAKPSFVRIGRQAVTWGEGRLLGVADWSPAGRTLDAARGRLVVGDGAFELLAASLSDPAQLGLASYGELFGARAEWAFDPLLQVELYALARFAQMNPNNDFEGAVLGSTYTASLRVHGAREGWSYGAEGAYQMGRVHSLDEDRAAWAAAGHVGYAFEHVLMSPAARLGGAYASGDDGSGTYHAFDPILPDVHTWHGAMDVFAWSNEIEGNARASIVPWTDAVASVEYRYARLAQAGGAWRTDYVTTIGQAPANTQEELGHEIDAWLTWKPWAPVELSGGYSALVLGDGAKAILAASTPSAASVVQFAFLQASLRVP